MQNQVQAVREGRCPSCGKKSHFVYSGEQHWPLRVAQAAGISPVVQLWTCKNCHSTLSESNLG
jgi:transposase-like protein